MLFLRAHDLHIAKKLRKNETKAGRSSDAGTIIVTPRKRKNDVLPSQIPITTTVDFDRWRVTTKCMFLIAAHKGNTFSNDNLKFLSSEERRSAGYAAVIRQFDVLWIEGAVNTDPDVFTVTIGNDQENDDKEEEEI
ncbi:hypothetical protein MCOR07_010611 [Pyricularia oryzae]|nr:hypothetical protein MCOR32_007919 [Pyricularia oryzae]KAI6386783.1 hypothetical protein MCOR23_011329 [Pyricularia oryzae]KAI6519693.1 hypothetical protein MCOR05_011020 [Pyricularia oryzae]KAI6583736.1 hypothetical protein MCOR12_010773 [Pyricularia oryzae]KAI6610903.1 hypothetical protein MCOR07_010611 [Pyricularia oryzae]